MHTALAEMRLPLPPSVNHDERYDADSQHTLRSKASRSYHMRVAQYVTYELGLNDRIHQKSGWALPARCGSPTAGCPTWTTTSRGCSTPCRLPLPPFRPPVPGSHRQSPRCGFVRLCRTVRASCVPESGRGSHGMWSVRGGGAVRQRPRWQRRTGGRAMARQCGQYTLERGQRSWEEPGATRGHIGEDQARTLG